MRWIYLTAVWLHVLAAMTWVGGMVLFVVALMPFFRRQDEAVRAAFLEQKDGFVVLDRSALDEAPAS